MKKLCVRDGNDILLFSKRYSEQPGLVQQGNAQIEKDIQRFIRILLNCYFDLIIFKE